MQNRPRILYTKTNKLTFDYMKRNQTWLFTFFYKITDHLQCNLPFNFFRHGDFIPHPKFFRFYWSFFHSFGYCFYFAGLYNLLDLQRRPCYCFYFAGYCFYFAGLFYLLALKRRLCFILQVTKKLLSISVAPTSKTPKDTCSKGSPFIHQVGFKCLNHASNPYLRFQS